MAGRAWARGGGEVDARLLIGATTRRIRLRGKNVVVIGEHNAVSFEANADRDDDDDDVERSTSGLYGVGGGGRAVVPVKVERFSATEEDLNGAAKSSGFAVIVRRRFVVRTFARSSRLIVVPANRARFVQFRRITCRNISTRTCADN